MRIRAAICGVFLLVAATRCVSSQETAADIDAAARRAYAAGQYAVAADLAKRLYEMRRVAVPADELETATAAYNVGRASVRADRIADAIRYFTIACDTVERSGNLPGRLGACLIDLAEALAKGNEAARARQRAARALSLIEQAYPPDGYAAALFHTGEVFRDAKENQTAIRYFQQAAALYEPSKLNNPGFLDASLLETAQLLHEERRYREAAAALERVIPQADVNQDRWNASIASRIYLLADCYSQTGDYDKALSLLDKVARSLAGVTVAGHTAAEDVLLEIARLQYRSGGNAEALSTIDSVLKRPVGDDVVGQRRSVSALELAGRVSASLHEYQDSEGRFTAAVQAARGFGGDDALLADTLTELGFFLLRRGRNAEARPRLEEALTIVERVNGRDSIEVADLLERESVGLINQNDCATARPVIARARTIFTRRAPETPEMVNLLALGSRCAATKAQRSALMAESLTLQKRLEGESAAWLVASASHYKDQGELAQAEIAVNRALTLEPENGVARELMADILDDRGQHLDAARLLRERIAATAASYGEDSLNVAARRFNLGRMLLRAGDGEGARDAFLTSAMNFNRHVEREFTMLSLAEQQQLLSQQTAAQVSGVLSVCQDGPCLTQGYSIMVSWKGLVVDVLRRQNELVRSERASVSDPSVARLRQLRAQLVLWASTREARAYDEWKPKYDALRAEKEALERRVLASGSGVRLGSINLQDVQRALGESEALVDIYRYDQFDGTRAWEPIYAAIITGRTSAPRFVKIGSAKRVEALVAQWLAGVEADHSDAAWATFRKTVWMPLLSTLPEGTRVVRVSGEADLLRIPWHTLTERDPARQLDVVEVSSARSLLDARSRRRVSEAPERVIVVGALDYDAGRTPRTPGLPNRPFPALPWTRNESQNILKMARDEGIDALWLSGAEGTRNAVLQQIMSGTYLHFATHGFVPDDSAKGTTPYDSEQATRTPLVDSGVALSGANVRDRATLQTEGILTAEEILDADMTRSRLVVLSACKTALGVKASGQGILGLRSSLHAAGARKILTSLWSVDDEATQLLMSDFYRRLWIEKKPLLIAFHEAQDSLRANPRFRAPRFWAGWSIVDPE